MNFFWKLIGKKESAPAPVAMSSSNTGDPIRVYDKYGRELLIERHEWLKVVQDNIRKVWNDPQELAGCIIQSLQDGFDAEMEEAAKQLQRIDPDKERGSILLAIVYLQTNRPKQALSVLTDYIKRHGESGVVLTNLAKAQSALGDEEISLATLWHALELDPNQDNGMGWYEAIHREKAGEQGSLDALRRIAALPGSWRAQLWLARHELVQGQLDTALSLYRQALEQAPQPTPTDLLAQLSGDLGNAGHLLPLLELTAPRFDIHLHGLQVGNNLIKAAIDTGQLDRARALLDEHQTEQRPDWRETLSVWETELQKAKIAIAEPLSTEKLECAMLTLPGPLWLPEEHSIRKHFPSKADDAPHLVFMGSTFESPRMEKEVSIQPTNNPGRYSRALPLLLSEHLYLRSPARTTTLIPWILNGTGGFVLSGKAYDDEYVAEQARQATSASSQVADYAVSAHLIVQGENFTLRLRLIRCIDGRCVGETLHHFAETAFHRVAETCLTQLGKLLNQEAEVTISSSQPTLNGAELDHYLLRLEQALAVSCSTMEERNAETLSNPAEILDGMLQFCLQNPKHLPSRMLLLRTLRKLRKPQPSLTRAMRPKVESLLEEQPIAAVQKELRDELKSVFEEE